MRTIDDHFADCMKDPEFARVYEEMKPELETFRALTDARTQKSMTQKELAKKAGIRQSEISRIESGKRNPSVKLLQRIADAMGMTLEIKFLPKS